MNEDAKRNLIRVLEQQSELNQGISIALDLMQAEAERRDDEIKALREDVAALANRCDAAMRAVSALTEQLDASLAPSPHRPHSVRVVQPWDSAKPAS